jgi:hypothetical protein
LILLTPQTRSLHTPTGAGNARALHYLRLWVFGIPPIILLRIPFIVPACHSSTSYYLTSTSSTLVVLVPHKSLVSDAARSHALTFTAQHLQTPQPINNSHAISQPAAANSTLSCLIEPEVLSAHRTFFHTALPYHTLLYCIILLYCAVIIINTRRP